MIATSSIPGSRSTRWPADIARRVASIVGLLATVSFAAPAGAAQTALPGAEPFAKDLAAQLAAASAARSPEQARTQNRNADGSPRFTNRLVLETSPYLLQHSNNPVNWYPWGDEAFEAARRLGRPVLVSIGYSTCHWCHVMEEESFDDVETATLLNQLFVAIKVDREARPDVDAIYMAALHAMGQSGGWPLNVWLTPDREPFYGGTYFPPADTRGRPGFRRVLSALADSYTKEPEVLLEKAQGLSAAVVEALAAEVAESSRMPGAGALTRSVQEYQRRYDSEWGGVQGRVKFPATLPLRNLLRIQRRTRDAAVQAMAVRTFEGMAAGGIFDQLGGGFHRYSTDVQWLVPHFEKMLYDNARLAVAYLEGWQVTGRADFAAVVRRTLDAMLRDFEAPDGGFYSATDADSATPAGESEEGRYFTWTPDELESVLGADDAKVAAAWYGVTPAGQLEGRSVLHSFETREAVAQRSKLSTAALEERLESIRARLLAARAKRPAPHRDEKILAAWNGLAVSALSRAGFALGEERYLEAARRASRQLLASRDADGRLRRVRLGASVDGPAFLEDYAFVISGLLDLYEADSDPAWLSEALALQDVLDREYGDATGGGYFRTATRGERLLVREKPASDGALPSGNGVAAHNLLRLSAFTSDEAYRERALLLFATFHDRMVESPTRSASLLLALDFELDDSLEVIVVLPADRGDPEPLLSRLRRTHRPNRVIAIVQEGVDLDAHSALVPLVGGKRSIRGRPTAYVCQNRTCRYPTHDPDEFQAQLEKAKPYEVEAEAEKSG